MLKNHLKKAAVWAVCAPMRGVLPGAAAVMYHSINPVAHRQSITPAVFRQHLAFLRDNNFLSVTASNLLPTLTSRKQKVVCLTFDDGFVDNYEFAVPLLREFNCAATFFVPTNFIGAPSILPEFSGMNLGQLTEVANDPLFEIGSHALSHPRLSTLPAPQAEQEIRESKKVLEEILGRPVTSFAYPYGDFSPREVASAKSAGYAIAFSTVRRRLSNSFDPLAVPRLPVDMFTAPFFADFFGPGLTAYWRIFDAAYMPLKKKLYAS